MTPLTRLFSVLMLTLVLHAASDAAGKASLSPANPAIGDEITFRYEPTASATEKTEVVLELMLVRESARPVVIEQSMSKTGPEWTTSITLDDEKARLLLFRFASGDRVDDRDGSSWESLVYDGDGTPLRGAHLFNASSLSGTNFYGFSRPGDADLAVREAEAESSLYPDSYEAKAVLWTARLGRSDDPETVDVVKKELEEVYSRVGDDEKAVSALLPWFGKTGQEEREASLRNAAIAQNPHGVVAESTRREEVFNETDRQKRVALYEQFMKDFPKTGDEQDDANILLVRLLTSAKQYDRAAEILRTLPNRNGDLYNSIAWGIISNGENVAFGVDLAGEGIALYRTNDPSLKPSYMTTRDWNRNQDYGLGAISDTYAYGLEKLGRHAEAEQGYETAFEKLEGEDPDVNERLVACYVTNGHYEKATTTARKCVEKGSTTDGLLDQYRIAYTGLHGSEEGFADEFAAARTVALDRMREEMMANRVNQPAPDFSLENLYGGTTKLSDLKGKVVVVDFWATWCGPCVSSFPFLQKIVDEYIHDTDVVILTLNTWERQNGEERVAAVRKFMEDNHYTFNVLLDENVVNEYQVEGIPTKFLIDRNGMIQFRSIGFMGGPQMMDEMRMQLQILLSKEFYSMKD